MTPTVRTTIALLVASITVLSGCADEESAQSDVVAVVADPGTATAGGNPAIVIGFTYLDRPNHPEFLWRPPVFHIGELRFATGAGGACDLDAAPWRTLDASVALDTNTWLQIARTAPCAIEMRPRDGFPMIEVQTDLENVGRITVAYPLPEGVILEITQVDRLTELRRGFLFIDIDTLLDDIDVDAVFGEEGEVLVSDAELADVAGRFRDNLAAATTMYLDTVPDTPELDEASRAPENVFARFRLPE